MVSCGASAVLAALPLLVLLVLMLWRGWSAARAGLAGLIVAATVGWLQFGLTAAVVSVSLVRGLALAAYVLYVIWPALLLYCLLEELGTVNALVGSIAMVVRERSLAAIALAWPLASMLEGIAGFGVPIVVVAPMLVQLGIEPTAAVAAVALGHAWSVTFGDMGVVFEALLSVTGQRAAAIAPQASVLLGAAAIASGLLVAGRDGLSRTVLPRLLAAGVSMAGVQMLVALSALRPLAGFLAGAAGVLVFLLLCGPRGKPIGAVSRLAPLLAYALAALPVAAQAFSPAARQLLSTPATAVDLPAVVTRCQRLLPAGRTKPIAWLGHPGGGLVLAAFALALALLVRTKASPEPLLRAARRAVRMAWPATAGIAVMMVLASLMEGLGMMQALGAQLAQAFGRLYPAVAPLIGLMGALATGSNTNANVLFGPMQLAVAQGLALSPGWILAGQTSGAALGSMVAPAKLVLGCASVGIPGKEGQVLRLTLARAAILLALTSLLAVGGVLFTPTARAIAPG